MENAVLSVLIQGGAVGICLVVLLIHYKGDERCSKAIENNTRAQIQNTEINTRLACAIESLEKTVESKL